MFRRPIIVWGRPFARRPRLLGAALVGGAGYALGRSSRRSSTTAPAAGPAQASAYDAEPVARLKELADLHAAGALTDEEYAAAKRRLLAE